MIVVAGVWEEFSGGFPGHGRCLVSRRRQISARAKWHAVSRSGVGAG